MASKGRISLEQMWAKAVAKAWHDDEFRALLEKDPRKAFDKLGYSGKILKLPAKKKGVRASEFEKLFENAPRMAICTCCC